MRDDEYFLVLNPDVYIEDKELEQAISLIKKKRVKVSTINLMKEGNTYDNNIRFYPSFSILLNLIYSVKTGLLLISRI